jgi:hypothetical protein
LQRRSDRRSESQRAIAIGAPEDPPLSKHGLERYLADHRRSVGDEASTLEDLIVEIRVAVSNAGVPRDVSARCRPVPIAGVF